MLSLYSSLGEKVALDTLSFPGGEMHVRVQTGVCTTSFRLVALLQTPADCMTLLLATDAIKRAYPGCTIALDMPYVPYARQDRVANAGEPLSARVFCDLINGLGFSQVRVEDPHSDVTPALLNNVVIMDSQAALTQVVSVTGPVALVAPDAGARKRVSALARTAGLPVVFADKVRDTLTGLISGTEISGEIPDLPLLVVDDICDGGRTFIELAKAIQAKRPTSIHPLYLYVTHGIFSKGLTPLLAHYQSVFTRYDWTADDRSILV